ncbi:MAG: ASKHA domain-containing protein [Actinomycetota bacterium]
MAEEHRVVFTPSGLRGSVAAGTTVLDAARSLGVDLDSVCGGRGLCGRCRVLPTTGELATEAITSRAEHLSAPGELEANYRGRRTLDGGIRLGCAARIEGDVVVDVPPESQLVRPVVRKSVDVDNLLVEPEVVLHVVELTGGGDDDPRSATERLTDALAEQWQLHDVSIDRALLPTLHAAVATPQITVARRRHEVVAWWPGYVDRATGAAIDVGSTTVAGHLCDLATGEVLASAGRMNPQIRFGEDLMSRVSYAMLNEGGSEELTRAIRDALRDLLAELVAGASDQLDRTQLLDVVIVGNPVMHHIALGIDPTPLGQSPFTLATSEPLRLPAADLDLGLGPGAQVYVGPCIAGHVGADTAAAILASGMHRSERRTLLVDVGTNAEIVLGDRHGLLAASSPTGPAFEGAQISAGQRAAAGAIERVRIDRLTLEPRFKVIGAEPWSDEPGFDAAVAASGVTGICGSGIIEVISELFLSGVIDRDGLIVSEGIARSPRVVPDGNTFSYVLCEGVSITQNDVRAIQLAKAALRAGIELLIDHAGTRQIDDVQLAGAFGAHIDPLHAMVLGLVPDGPVDAVRSVGNAAGTGAVRALLSQRERHDMEQAVAGVTKIETATEPSFQEHFVAALAFPHRDAPSPHLATVVTLPEQPEVHPGSQGRGRRRRRGRARPTESSAPSEAAPSAEPARSAESSAPSAEPARSAPPLPTLQGEEPT